MPGCPSVQLFRDVSLHKLVLKVKAGFCSSSALSLHLTLSPRQQRECSLLGGWENTAHHGSMRQGFMNTNKSQDILMCVILSSHQAGIYPHLKKRELLQLGGLFGCSIILYTKRLQAGFLLRPYTRVVGLIPSWSTYRRQPIAGSLSH